MSKKSKIKKSRNAWAKKDKIEQETNGERVNYLLH